jgi:biopolymer transport protein ExbD
MQFVDRPRRRPTINITSLIDVLFLLLTFFLVTTSFIEQSTLKIELPSMQNSDMVQQERRFILDMGSNGEMNYDGVGVDKNSLVERLKGTVEEINAGGGLVLRADETIPHGDVMMILDLIKGAGVRRFVIATVQPGE